MHAVYSNFPYVLGFVVLLTFILLARAFRSLVLPLKAALLNLISLGAAYGIIVFIFQQGHGSEAIWGVHATQSIIPWIPLMIFAFLFGLSMDYEVFMLTRMREAYDETGDTTQAIALGLARTGKLVTSAALVLMFAFFVLVVEPRHRHQAVRHRARGRDHLRRDGDPRAARARAHAPARHAGTGGCRARSRACCASAASSTTRSPSPASLPRHGAGAARGEHRRSRGRHRRGRRLRRPPPPDAGPGPDRLERAGGDAGPVAAAAVAALPGAAAGRGRVQPRGRCRTRLRSAVVPRGQPPLVQASVVGQQGAGVRGLSVDVGGTRALPCGAGCYRATVPLGRSIDLRCAAARRRPAGRSRCRRRGRPPARPRSSRAPAACGARSHSLAFTDRLASDASHAVVSTWRAVAPDRLAYRIRDGWSAVIIGGRRWDRAPGGRWIESPQTATLRQPVPLWQAATDAHVIGSTRTAWRISFFDPRTPAWFQITVDKRTLHTVELHMTTTAHFMHETYRAFDAAGSIAPPPTSR